MKGDAATLLLVMKPLIYFWIFILAWRRIPADRRPPRGAPLAAAFTRTFLALLSPLLLVGIQRVFGQGAGFLGIVWTLRGIVWLLCGALFLKSLGKSGFVTLALVGATLEALFDLSIRPGVHFL